MHEVNDINNITNILINYIYIIYYLKKFTSRPKKNIYFNIIIYLIRYYSEEDFDKNTKN